MIDDDFQRVRVSSDLSEASTSASDIEVQSDNSIPQESDLTLTDALKTSQFWLIYLMALFSIFQGFYVLNVFKDYGQTVSILKDDAYLT